jgi:hypothetical protein
MTETTAFKSEIGTCVGCRVPCWRETHDGCSRKNAVLVTAGDSGVEITEILVPARENESGQIPGDPEIIIGVRV